MPSRSEVSLFRRGEFRWGGGGVKQSRINSRIHDQRVGISSQFALGLFIVVLCDIGGGAAGTLGDFTGALMEHFSGHHSELFGAACGVLGGQADGVHARQPGCERTVGFVPG